MSVKIVVPALGESVSEATVAKWHKKAGDSINTDELLLELETEKVTLEVNAPSDGVLESIDKKEGQTVLVGDILGSIMSASKASSAGPAPAPTPTPANNDVLPQSQKKAIDKTEAIPPSAQKLIVENKLNPANIPGTGKDGRINKGDVLNVLNNTPTTSATVVVNVDTPARLDGAHKKESRVPMSRLRKTIAQRLKDSQNTAAILSTFNEIDMSKAMALRAKYKDQFQEKHGTKLGFMSFFAKAVISALKAVPSVNTEISGDDIIYKYYYDIGVAVGTKQGLVVPVLRDVDTLSFASIEQELVSVATRARDGKLAMSDLSGATFSITNGGVYGSLLSTPIINPPQTGILGLHSIQERPVAIDGKVEIRPMMYVALSYDHRIIDGKDAVTFLVKVKQAMEDPERMLLEV